VGGIVRRDFLKACLSGVGCFLLEHYLSLFSYAKEILGGRQVSRYTGKFLRGIPSTCEICRARCGIIGFLEGNQLYKIGGNPRHLNNRGRICSRGLAGVNIEYDPERILLPMIRRGKRGSDNWEKISWGKAMDELANRMRIIRDSGKTEEILFHAGGEETLLAKRFLGALGNPTVIDEEGLNRLNKVVGQRLTWGAGVEVPDVANSRYILNFGSNPYENHEFFVGLIGRLVEARLTKGAKLVTFDPRLSKTAGNSDEWFPIRPGTDGLVALAMAHTIMKLELYDREFLERWTNISPQRLTEYLSPYTPEKAEEISGISAGDITRIAGEFAGVKPATTLSGGGVVKHLNGVHNERCVALLNAITGNIDTPGGYCLPRTYGLEEADIPAFASIPAQRALTLIREGRVSCKLYFSYKSNPAYSNPDKKLVEEVLQDEKSVPYLVVMDTHMTETAHVADLFLPAATYLESWGLTSPPALDMIPFIALRQPIVKPMGKSRPVDEVLAELALKIGGGMERSFTFKSIEDHMVQVISRIDGLVRMGGLDYLKEHGVWFDPEARQEYRGYRRGGFNTPSGKFEIASEELKKRGFPSLPVFEPIPGHETLRGEFILTTFKPGLMTGRTGNSKWLSEIVHENPLWINKIAAAEFHIEKGDLVKVTSQLGSFVARAHLTQGINPWVIAIAAGLGHWKYGHIARAKKFKSRDPDTQLLWWGEDWFRVNPNAAIPEGSDPIGGGQAWMDTRVSIMKI
jgi:thiosulfate reductase/polysulfide reductase chain A